MKKSIVALLALLLGSVASAQVPSYTPNISLQVPAYGQTNWQVPLNYNSYLLDRLLSGNAVLPGLSVSGPANFTQLTSWQGANTYPACAVVVYLGTFYSSIAGGNFNNLPTNASFWSTTLCSSSSTPTGSPNLVYATPTGTGGAALLRSLVAADLPTATNSVPGIGRPDGTTITAVGGIWSALGTSQRVVIASSLSGAHAGVTISPGSSAASTSDSSTALNTALAAGNTKLVLDSGFALSTTLLLYTGDTLECTSRNNGVIMMVASNAPAVANAHQNAPTTASGTGGFLPSNITDTNLDVHGCLLNDNSTEAATGSNSQGVAHSVNPSTGLFVTGTFFDGVQNLNFVNNEVYDAGVWSTFFSNVLYANISNNFIHLPTPVTHKKFTDGVHIIGPASYVTIDSNIIQAGDDSIALNAEDGNRTGSGDPNFSYAQWAGVKWGPETHIHADNNIFLNGFFGPRILSNSELVDDISFTNTTGNLCGNTFTMQASYPSFGNGNVGTVTVNGWNVPTTGACNDFTQPYNWSITENYQNLNLSNITLSPGINWPLITHNVVSPGILSLNNINVTSTSLTGFSLFSFTGGAAPLLSSNGLKWNDNASNTGTAFAGTLTPSTLTCSNYAGPNRLLGSGFAPVISNGDCFTNTYTAVAVTYVNTTFSEHTSGALATTAPATCTNGCSGNWTASSGGPSGTGVWTYGTNLVTLSGACTSGGPDNFCPVYINAGVANYTLRVTVSQFDSGTPLGLAFVERWTNNTNFVTFLPNGGSGSSTTWGLYDVVSGTTTQIGSSVVLGNAAGVWTVTMTGTSASLKNPAGTTLSGTISGSNTATNVGLSSNLTSFVGSDIITALSVKSF